MLDFESFQQYVKDNIKDFLPSEFSDAEVNLQTVNKNNGKQLHGITIRTGENPVCPNIYLDQFYENYKEQGMDIDVVMERVAQLELENVIAKAGQIDGDDDGGHVYHKSSPLPMHLAQG